MIAAVSSSQNKARTSPIFRTTALRGEFNRSLQHILRTSQPASDRARSFSAFH
jgi:hypothetical protein